MAGKSILDDIRPQLDQLIEEHSLNGYPSNKRDGKAFEHWCLDLLGQWHTNLDTDPYNLPDSGDGGVDILLEDAATNRFFLAQCAYVGRNGQFNLDKFGRLCALAGDIFDENRVIGGGYGVGEDTKAALIRVARRVAQDGASVELFYITTASATETQHTKAATLSTALGEQGVAVRLWDGSQLRRLLTDVAAIEASAIEEVDLPIPANEHFSLSCGGRSAYVVALKASAAAALYDKHQQRLLAWNIRSYLGANSINSSIRDTAASRGDEFFLCNNGVTAIAKEVCPRQEGAHHFLLCKKFQVINGGQTLASLNEVYKQPANRSKLNSIDVLFTIIETEDISPVDPFNQRVIQARNTQNKVLLSDFRSNDPIQQWLAAKLPGYAASILPKDGLADVAKCRKIHYKPKRDFVRKPGSLKLQLEDLAKIRYAYLHDPWTVLAYVNQLWTRRGDEIKEHPGKAHKGKHDARGKYERAFGCPTGKDGEWELPKTWEDGELTHCVFAIVVHTYVDARIKNRLAELREKVSSGESLTEAEELQKLYITRARYHMVALAGEKYRSMASNSLKKLMGEPTQLLSELDRHWKKCLLVFTAQIDKKLGSIGRDSILRDPDVWKDGMIPFFKQLDALN